MDKFSCVYCGGFTTKPIYCTFCSQWACSECVACDEEESGGWLCELCTDVLGGGLEELTADGSFRKVG